MSVLLSCKISVLEEDLSIVKRYTGAKDVIIDYNVNDVLVHIYEDNMNDQEKKLFIPVLSVIIDDFMSKYRPEVNVRGKTIFKFYNDKNEIIDERNISNNGIREVNRFLEKTKEIFVKYKKGESIGDYFLNVSNFDDTVFFKDHFEELESIDINGYYSKDDICMVYIYGYFDRGDRVESYIFVYDKKKRKVESIKKY
ncbi:hypothetical protein [Tenacibaculum sp. C7A-26P2]|uniref:hypothetical protein n=1 Tax=Tenacibaculum sp. C7A-26P2 TaxID=3447504 RepID=UPI003F8289BE